MPMARTLRGCGSTAGVQSGNQESRSWRTCMARWWRSFRRSTPAPNGRRGSAPGSCRAVWYSASNSEMGPPPPPKSRPYSAATTPLPMARRISCAWTTARPHRLPPLVHLHCRDAVFSGSRRPSARDRRLRRADSLRLPRSPARPRERLGRGRPLADGAGLRARSPNISTPTRRWALRCSASAEGPYPPADLADGRLRPIRRCRDPLALQHLLRRPRPQSRHRPATCSSSARTRTTCRFTA